MDISQKKIGSTYAQSPRKCSNIEILAKIEGKEAKFFSKIYKGHIRIWFRSKKIKIISCLCTFKEPLLRIVGGNMIWRIIDGNTIAVEKLLMERASWEAKDESTHYKYNCLRGSSLEKSWLKAFSVPRFSRNILNLKSLEFEARQAA